MVTEFTLMRPDGTAENGTADLAEQPGYATLKALLDPLLGGDLEHVSVLHDGERRDMFVHETGALDGLPRNEAATRIYRNATLTREPRTDPETIPAIYGPAVLFARRVWW